MQMTAGKFLSFNKIAIPKQKFAGDACHFIHNFITLQHAITLTVNNYAHVLRFRLVQHCVKNTLAIPNGSLLCQTTNMGFTLNVSSRL